MRIPIFLTLLTAIPVALAEDLLKPVGGVGSGQISAGLQLTLKPVKEEFGPGESIVLRLAISNVSDADRTIQIVPDEPWYMLDADVRFQDRDLKLPVRSDLADKRRRSISGVALPPGKTYEAWLDLRARIWSELSWLDNKGGYQVRVTLRKDGVASGWASFRIAEAGTPRPQLQDAQQAEEIRTLIAQLGHDDFKVRETASAQLVEMGEAAVGMIEEAAEKTGDAEVKLRCRQVVERIRAVSGQRRKLQPLCAACQHKAFTADVGRCRHCQGFTPSGSWHSCANCAAKLGICPACGTAMHGDEPRPILPPRPPRPIRPVRPQPRPLPEPLPVEPQPAPVEPVPEDF